MNQGLVELWFNAIMMIKKYNIKILENNKLNELI